MRVRKHVDHLERDCHQSVRRENSFLSFLNTSPSLYTEHQCLVVDQHKVDKVFLYRFSPSCSLSPPLSYAFSACLQYSLREKRKGKRDTCRQWTQRPFKVLQYLVRGADTRTCLFSFATVNISPVPQFFRPFSVVCIEFCEEAPHTRRRDLPANGRTILTPLEISKTQTPKLSISTRGKFKERALRTHSEELWAGLGD